MHLPPALLALPLLLAALLAAETPPGPPESPAEPTPSEEKPDAELEAVRRLLEAGGLIVMKLTRMESGTPCATARLGLSENPRLRSQEFFVFADPSRTEGLWLVRLGMPGQERAGLNTEPTEAREELADRLDGSPFLRDVVSGGDEEGDARRTHLFHAAHHATASDPRAFAAFVADVSESLSALFSVEAEGLPLLITMSERKRQPLVMAQKNLADRLRVRAIQGLPPPRAGSPEAEDPLSMASHPLDPHHLHPIEGADCAPGILPELESSGLAGLPGHRALRHFLGFAARPEDPASLASLRELAHAPGGEPLNAWALYHLGRHLMATLPEEDQAPEVVRALDILRQSVRLGCEVALGYYLHVLGQCDEPLVGAESHWEERARWEALWRHFNPHEIQEAVEVEQAYRSADLSPVLVGVDAEGEELRQVRLAVEEMNAARKARGWKLIQVVEEKPASEPLVEDAPKKEDPAGAGSSRGA